MASDVLQALDLILKTSVQSGTLSKLQSSYFLKKFKKREKKGDSLDFENLSHDWKFKISVARLTMGIYDWEGWEYRDLRKGMIPYDLPGWRGEACKLLVFGEQGIGDEVIFASCIPDVLKSGCDVTLECDPRLESIFNRSFPIKAVGRPSYSDVIISTSRAVDHPFKVPIKHDCEKMTAIGDLPRYFRRKKEDFPGTPYLTVDEKQIERFKGFRGYKGLSWRGRTGQYYPEDLLKDGPWVSLQYDSKEALPEQIEVPDLDLKDDIEGILGLLYNLDYLISVPTTVVHLAGSIGKKTEVIMPKRQTTSVDNPLNWRYGLGSKMDLYQSHRVFRNLNEWKLNG